MTGFLIFLLHAHLPYVRHPEHAGLMVFGRDFKSARQVWCASRGYPGDFSYRDFYRDIGLDLPLDYVSRFTYLNINTFAGMKYYSITGNTENKLPYNRVKAMEMALEHAIHFIDSRESDIKRLSEFNFCPVIFSAFDAELFGHWIQLPVDRGEKSPAL